MAIKEPQKDGEGNPTFPVQPKPSPLWLEITKIAVPASTSIFLAFAVLFLGQSYTSDQAEASHLAQKQQIEAENRAEVKRHERDKQEREQDHDREVNARVVEKRVLLWDELAPCMNDVYAYFMYVGDWKNFKATQIVAKKREMDRLVFSYRPFFSEAFFKAYQTFIDAAYKPNTGWRKDAMLRTTNAFRDDTDPERFTGIDNRDEIHKAYYEVMKAAATELNLNAGPLPPRPQGPPSAP